MKIGKKKYESPKYEVIRFDSASIINTQSGYVCREKTYTVNQGIPCTYGDPSVMYDEKD